MWNMVDVMDILKDKRTIGTEMFCVVGMYETLIQLIFHLYVGKKM